MSLDGCGCKDCKRVREHEALLLPSKFWNRRLQALRIGGVAMAAGMSRNFSVYTPEELQVFADKRVNAPVHIEVRTRLRDWKKRLEFQLT